MKNTIKKTAAVLSAAILGALPMANLLTANAALSNDKVKYVYGDINFDGKIDNLDASLTYSPSSLSAAQKKRADVNGDGKITSADRNIILAHVSNVSAGLKVYGDANNDKKVDMADAAIIAAFYPIGKSSSGSINLIEADVNSDGVINKCDYELVTRYLNGTIKTLYVNWGDVDSSESITMQDIFRLDNYVENNKSENLSDAEKRRADINLDGKINDADVQALLMRASVGYFMWAK